MTIGDGFPDVLSAAQAGAEWAFAQLYRDVNPPLLRYLAVRAPETADDLASDTWLGVARGLRSFVGDERDFRAWLFTIAHRRLVQHWRVQGRRPSTPAAPDTFTDQVAADDPEAVALAKLSARDATRIITSALSPDQADVVLLRILAGLDVDEVAAIMGKRRGTIRVLQHRALRRLAERMSSSALTP